MSVSMAGRLHAAASIRARAWSPLESRVMRAAARLGDAPIREIALLVGGNHRDRVRSRAAALRLIEAGDLVRVSRYDVRVPPYVTVAHPRPIDRRPLRAVVGTAREGTREYDVLECKHRVPVGISVAARRRCGACEVSP